MYKIQDTSLEWALQHLTTFYDSDFFPRLFEFGAIRSNWGNVKKYLQNLNIDSYAPKTPFVALAPKVNGTFRIVHQLEPLDALIYTALVYEAAPFIESYRIPEKRKIACLYRIKTDSTGSFFQKEFNGYPDFLSKSGKLAAKYPNGYVLVCDIVDFYNQIYLHRVQNVLSEAGFNEAGIIETFLSGLNTNTSRGIPVGPAPSILISEAIMSDINKKNLTETSSFAQYVDDIFIFFPTRFKAKFFLHNLTRYLHSTHRLVLSPEKTKISAVQRFTNTYLKDDDVTETEAIREKLLTLGGEYASLEEVKDFEELEAKDKMRLRVETYVDLFKSALERSKLEVGILRHIFRQAAKYKVRNLTAVILQNFEKLLPVIREVVTYLNKVLNARIVTKYKDAFEDLLKSKYLEMPYVNIWIFTLFQNESFNTVFFKIDYAKIIRVRERALIALRERNKTYIKDLKRWGGYAWAN